jgi:hypothetical protein
MQNKQKHYILFSYFSYELKLKSEKKKSLPLFLFIYLNLLPLLLAPTLFYDVVVGVIWAD